MLNRAELIDAIIERTIDGMDTRDLITFVGDVLYDQYHDMDDPEFEQMVRESFPDLIEEN